MPTRAQCPNPGCGRSYSLADGLATATARCPACRAVLTYPDTIAHKDTITPPAAEPLPEPLPADPTETAAPRRVGRFAVLGRLGSGAFGTVYKARDPQLERDVALKLPNPGMLDTPRRIERFLREAKAAARLRHPHIVPVYDAGRDGDRYYIASAFVDGKPLSDEVGDRGLDARRAAEIVRQLAEAVGYAHEQGVVHRDIKPANVMLDADGRPHLMDFGLAVRADEAEKLTSDGAVMGTPAYMAPEQAAGQKGDASPLSDQYSLGVLLYELIAGHVPFSGPPAAVIYLVIHKDPPALRTLRTGVPADLETVCLKAMAKRPEDRYPNCRALAEDLRLWLAGEPIAARRQTPVERTVRWVRRNRVVAALMLVTVVSLLLGTGVAGVFAGRAQSRARDAERALAAAREAEQAAEDARKTANATAENRDELLTRLLGEEGRGKDREKQVESLRQERQDRETVIGQLKGEVLTLRGDLDTRPTAAELAKLKEELARTRPAAPASSIIAWSDSRYAGDIPKPASFGGSKPLPLVPGISPLGDAAFGLTWDRPGRVLTVYRLRLPDPLPPPGWPRREEAIAHRLAWPLQVPTDRTVDRCSLAVLSGTTVAVVFHCSGRENTGTEVVGWYDLTARRGGEPIQPTHTRDGLSEVTFSPGAASVAFRELDPPKRVARPSILVAAAAWGGTRDGPDAPRHAWAVPRLPAKLIAVSDNGGWLAFTDGSVRSISESDPVTRFPGPGDRGPFVFSPKSTWLATIDPKGGDGSAVVCTPVRDPKGTPRTFVGHRGAVLAIGFTADESYMITSGKDGTIRVWNTLTAKCVNTFAEFADGRGTTQFVMTPSARRLTWVAGSQERLLASPNGAEVYLREASVWP